MKEIDKNRYDEIDIASGFVILLVVISHLVPFNGYIFRVIFSFHMPFFFLKSGYCAKEKTLQGSFRIFLKQKIKKLLFPSLIMNCITLAIGMATVNSLKDALYYIFVSPTHEWFMMALFVVQIVFYCFHKVIYIFDNPRTRNFLMIVCVAVLPMLSSIALERGWHDSPYLPFKLGSVLIGFMFTLIGYMGRCNSNVPIWRLEVEGKRIVWGGVSLLLLLLTYFNTYINVANCYWGRSDLYFVLTAFFWSLTVVVLSGTSLSHVKGNNKLLILFKVCGRNSAIIYLGQSVLFYILNKIVSRITGNMYTPMIDLPLHFSVIYCVVVLIILIPICILNDNLRKRKENKKKEVLK